MHRFFGRRMHQACACWRGLISPCSPLQSRRASCRVWNCSSVVSYKAEESLTRRPSDHSPAPLHVDARPRDMDSAHEARRCVVIWSLRSLGIGREHSHRALSRPATSSCGGGGWSPGIGIRPRHCERSGSLQSLDTAASSGGRASERDSSPSLWQVDGRHVRTRCVERRPCSDIARGSSVCGGSVVWRRSLARGFRWIVCRGVVRCGCCVPWPSVVAEVSVQTVLETLSGRRNTLILLAEASACASPMRARDVGALGPCQASSRQGQHLSAMGVRGFPPQFRCARSGAYWRMVYFAGFAWGAVLLTRCRHMPEKRLETCHSCAHGGQRW